MIGIGIMIMNYDYWTDIDFHNLMTTIIIMSYTSRLFYDNGMIIMMITMTMTMTMMMTTMIMMTMMIRPVRRSKTSSQQDQGHLNCHCALSSPHDPVHHHVFIDRIGALSIVLAPHISLGWTGKDSPPDRLPQPQKLSQQGSSPVLRRALMAG